MLIALMIQSLMAILSLTSELVSAQDAGARPIISSQDPLSGYSCDASKCRLPSCHCASKTPPIANPPQFLMLTFDDSIQASTLPQAQDLFKSLTNPNGCPARATWFTQVFYSDPFLATQWYAQGNEMYVFLCLFNVEILMRE